MDLIRQMSDDQLALVGCAGALAAAFTVMAISYHLGRVVRGGQSAKPSVRIVAGTSEQSAAPVRTRRAA